MNFSKSHNFILIFALAIIVGALAAIAAELFIALIAFLHNLFFLGHISFIYDRNVHTPPSMWGIGVIFIPMIGGLIVIWLIEHFAHDERGLSVPEIMHSIRYRKAKINPVVALAKTLASAISIGSGASIGREGPIIQIGAAISSMLCDLIHLSAEQRKILLAAGAAAATASIFNAPLAGIALAIELLLISFNVFSIFIIFVSVTTTIFINNYFFSNAPIFPVEDIFYITNFPDFVVQFLLFVFFGCVVGLFSVVFIRGVYWFEDTLVFWFKNPYLRHMMAMFIVGILLYLMMYFYSHYYIEGIGYATIKDCLEGILTDWWLLLLLFVGKLFVTCLSLGSGASGGIFSPSLFMGATLGTLWGIACNQFLPYIEINPIIFTIIGMSASVGSITGAVATSILLTFELTENWSAIFPMIISVIVAYIVRRAFCRYSVYTLKLYRRGYERRHFF